MTDSTTDSTTDSPDATNETSPLIATVAARSGWWRGMLAGLAPLALLVVLAITTLLATMVARLLAAPQGFFMQQQIAVIVLATGLAIATVTYLLAVARALRRAGQWRQSGATGTANAALVALALGALIVLLPVLLTLLLPQHPAP